MVGDQRLLRNVFQRDPFLLGQRVVQRQHQHVLPLITGQGDQLGVVDQRFGGDTDLGHLVHHHPGDLVGGTLVQAHVDLGVTLTQAGHGHRQHITRLGVGGGYGQSAAVFGAELLTNTFEVAHLAHDHFDTFQHVLARLGDTFESFAVPRKNLDT